MEYEVMRKKLDAYRKPSGQFRLVNGDLLIELLRMWECILDLRLRSLGINW